MGHGLISSGLAPWGQAAAFIIALYVFVSIIMGLVLVAVLMFLLAWLREKSELIRRLRPNVDQMNRGLRAAKRGDPLPLDIAESTFMRIVTQVPKTAATLPERASNIEQRVERGSDRVAETVIELRARAEMAKRMARVFFLPGLTKRRVNLPMEQVTHPEHEQVAAAEVRREEPPIEQEIVITQSFRSFEYPQADRQ